MKNLKTPEWRSMVREWRKEQLVRAHLAHSHWSIFHPPATCLRYCVDTTEKLTTVMIVMSPMWLVTDASDTPVFIQPPGKPHYVLGTLHANKAASNMRKKLIKGYALDMQLSSKDNENAMPVL